MAEPNARGVPLDRRTLLLGSGTLATAWLSAGCDLSSAPADDDDQPAAETDGQAPMLQELTDAGDLPPVEERLPDNPLVVEPNDRPGTYGGDWNTVLLGTSDTSWLGRTVGHEYLMRWDVGFTEPVPNVAEEVEISDDGTELTFTLRPGIRWSDGEPFTADDILFAYDNVQLHSELHATPPGIYVTGDSTAAVDKLDDHTVRFTFDPPNGLFVQLLATPRAAALTQHPKHYLEQFHADFNSDIDQLVEQEGQPDWIELFFSKADLWDNPELPRLHPWVPTSGLSDEQRIVYERNPYYWKVDPDGNQLPYLDRVIFSMVQDVEVILLNASNGEVDMQSRHVTASQDRPVLAENRQAGDYDFFTLNSTHAVPMVLALNLTAEDPVKREIFQNRDFRIGLSHAINRSEIIDTIYQRQGEPSQAAPREDSPYYDAEMATQYTEYDVDLANEYLDRAGYTETDADGRRLGPDGNPISFAVEVMTDTGHAGRESVDTLELIRGYLAVVGVDLQVNAIDRSLFTERRTANAHDASVWPAEDASGPAVALRTDWWFPSDSESRNYAPLWMEWYQSGGEQGEEPPQEVRQQMQVYEQQVRTALDDDERVEAMREVLRMSREIFYHIGINQAADQVGIVRNDFHNVPASMPDSFYYPTPGPTNPEQYFKQPDT